jgi:hypothetical protein
MAKISNVSAYPNINNVSGSDYLIITDSENNLMTKTVTLTQVQTLFGIDTYVAHAEVTPTEMQNLAPSPKTIIDAPGANNVIDLLSISVYGKYGTTTYNFSDDLEFDCNSTVFASLAAVSANSSQDFVQKLMIGGAGGNSLTLSANQALTLTTSANPTQGDGTFFVNAYYRILTVGTTF